MSYLRGFTLASFVFTERTTLFFTVMAYALNGNDITADKVFSMAQYFNILQLTMAIFYPMAVAASAEAFVSINRLQVYKIICTGMNSGILVNSTCIVQRIYSLYLHELSVQIGVIIS